MNAFRLLLVLPLLLMLLPVGARGYCGCENPADGVGCSCDDCDGARCGAANAAVTDVSAALVMAVAVIV